MNALGNQLQVEGRAGYNCASNEANAAKHIWNMLDANEHKGATVCIVIPDFADAHSEKGGWQMLAE